MLLDFFEAQFSRAVASRRFAPLTRGYVLFGGFTAFSKFLNYSRFVILTNAVGAGFSRPNAPTGISVDTADQVFSGRQTLPLQVSRALKRLNDT